MIDQRTNQPTERRAGGVTEKLHLATSLKDLLMWDHANAVMGCTHNVSICDGMRRGAGYSDIHRS